MLNTEDGDSQSKHLLSEALQQFITKTKILMHLASSMFRFDLGTIFMTSDALDTGLKFSILFGLPSGAPRLRTCAQAMMQFDSSGPADKSETPAAGCPHTLEAVD